MKYIQKIDYKEKVEDKFLQITNMIYWILLDMEKMINNPELNVKNKYKRNFNIQKLQMLMK